MDRLNKAALYVLVGVVCFQAGRFAHKFVAIVGNAEFFDVFRTEDEGVEDAEETDEPGE